jgi:hypothetical protein
MARIPDRAPMGAPRTPVAGGRAASFGDLGLSAVGEGLARTGQAMQGEADRRAAEAFDRTQSEYEAAYLPAAQVYDGRTPGFAREQMAVYDGALAATAEGLDPDARRSFERMRPQRRAAQFEAAVRVEAQRGGERQRQAIDRQNSIDAIGRLSGLGVAYAETKRGLIEGYDGSEAGLTDKALAEYDRLSAERLAEAPEAVREMMAASIASSRATEWLGLQQVEATARSQWEVKTTGRAAEGLIASVTTDPGRYDEAQRQMEALVVEQPAALQDTFRDTFGRDLAVARFNGLLERGQWEAALSDLDGGQWDQALGADRKAQVRGSVLQYRQAAGFDPVSVQRQLAQQTMEERVRSHLMSIQTTGVGSGVSADDVRAVGGPVAVATLQRQESQARLAYSVTRGLAGLPLAEQRARVESLKPKGGEADFADRQAAYAVALETLATAQQLQAADPARAVQADDASAGLWRRFAAEPNGQNGRLWAEDTLRRQRAMGVAEPNQRILPVAEAQRVAGAVKSAQGPATLEALSAAAGFVASFGGHEGRVLTELTRAGLNPTDAAMIGLAGDNPVAMEEYARARARGNVGLTPTIRREARSEVVDVLEPLLSTWRPLAGGQAGSDAFVNGVEAVAASKVADGMTPRQAAREAAEAYLNAYRFEGGWRIPAAEAGRQVRVLNQGRRRAQDIRNERGGRGRPNNQITVDGTRAAEIGAQRVIYDLVAGDGARLFAAGGEAHFSDAQKRARYAGLVATSGRWITTPDDRALQLVRPDPGAPGGVTPVLNSQGQPIYQSWEQLRDRATRPLPEEWQ